MVSEKYHRKTKIKMFFMMLYEDQSISSFTVKHKYLRSKLGFIKTTINYCTI